LAAHKSATSKKRVRRPVSAADRALAMIGGGAKNVHRLMVEKKMKAPEDDTKAEEKGSTAGGIAFLKFRNPETGLNGENITQYLMRCEDDPFTRQTDEERERHFRQKYFGASDQHQ